MHPNNSIIVKPIDNTCIDQIVVIHLRAFHESTLSLFGRDVLVKWYKWHFSAPNECYGFGAFEGDCLKGFCLAGIFRDAEVFFFRENFIYMLYQALIHPRLIINKQTINRLKQIFQAFKGRLVIGTKKAEKVTRPRSEKFGILSIAVDPNSQGSGIGSLLMNEVELLAKQKDISSIRLTVDPANKTAVRFYEKQGWQKVYYDSDKPWQGYMMKDLR
jgi:ribosomal protein S18 acetylase RimI-like enzyme